MKIETGYLYHIKDSFFELIKDDGLMKNHELGNSRPTYFTIKDNEILWFIPLSSKVEKYKKIIEQKTAKYGSCKTIMVDKIAGKEVAILLQNAFPTLEKYISHAHVINGNPIKVIDSLKEKITKNFNYMISMKKGGKNLFFTDIDKIEEILSKEN